MSKLTADYLRELFTYDHTTGIFTRSIQTSTSAPIGSVAGTKNGQGYIRIAVNGRGYQAHRLAWLYHYGTWPTNVIDHIDGNRANNSIDNLRDCTRSQNLQNMKRQKHNKAGLKGVSLYKDRKVKPWRATICGTLIGRYDTKEEAHEAYVAEAKRRFGDFAREN